MSETLFLLVAIRADHKTRFDPNDPLHRSLQKIVAAHVEMHTMGPIPEVLVTPLEQTAGVAGAVVFRERAGAIPAGAEFSSPAG